MKRLLKLLKKPKSAAGFTLIELLVAMAITTIVVGITGWGVVAITQKSKEQKLETDRRVELNRALDFIADEVRQAKPIATNASADLGTIASSFTSTNRTPVLTLQIPGVSQRVIYYIASSSSPWLGPNVVYRWGPSFNANGTYSNPTDPTSWTGEPLVDLISNETPSSNPNCDTNWTPNPAVASRTGFYTCVDPSGKIANIHLRGKLVDAYNVNKTAFEVSTKAFARPYNPPFTLNSGSSNSGGNGGTITITQSSTMYVEVLGGSITCGAAGAVIPTTTTVNVTPSGGTTTSTTLPSSTKSLNLSVGVGTTLTFTGDAPIRTTCGSGYPANSTYNSQTNNGTQVLTLRNGDTVPLTTPFGRQPTIDSYLTKYIDPTTKKVKLAENQVIYLYELGSTTTTEASFDVQDLVVLATIAPSNN